MRQLHVPREKGIPCKRPWKDEFGSNVTHLAVTIRFVSATKNPLRSPLCCNLAALSFWGILTKAMKARAFEKD